MNGYAAYTQPVPGGYRVMMRLCRDAKPRPVMRKGGFPAVFPDEAAALQAAVHHLLAFMNGNPIRGEIFEGPLTGSRSAAEELFKQERESA